jgi:hypothetical protein
MHHNFNSSYYFSLFIFEARAYGISKTPTKEDIQMMITDLIALSYLVLLVTLVATVLLIIKG